MRLGKAVFLVSILFRNRKNTFINFDILKVVAMKGLFTNVVLELFFISFGTTFLLLIFNKITKTTDRMRRISSDISEYGALMRKHLNDKEKASYYSSQLLKHTFRMFLETFFVTIKKGLFFAIIYVPLFNILKPAYANTGTFIDVGFYQFGWIGFFVLLSIFWGINLRIFFKKFFDRMYVNSKKN